MFAVVVTLTLKPDTFSQFLPLMHTNALASKAEEGCYQFDVCTDPARPNEVFLYETYVDSAAFALHLKTTHFLQFDQRTSDMIAQKDVRTFERVQP